MQLCTCTTTQHDNHPGKTCDMTSNTDDAYCKECRDKRLKEHADTEPDMLSYQSRSQVTPTTDRSGLSLESHRDSDTAQSLDGLSNE